MPEPNACGLKYEEVVGLTWLAYNGQGSIGRWRFPNAGSVWNLTKVYQVLNFRAVLVEGSRRVLSFSGTDQLTDWGDNVQQGLLGYSPQYLGALAVALNARPEIVVGHSLGGGLASYVAIYQGRKAATVNPAPLNINLVSGLPMIINNGNVFNYVVRGEALDLLDTYTLGMRRIGTIHYVASTGTDVVAKHLLPNLVGFTAPVRA